MPQLNVRNATFRGCRCHTWTAVKCGIAGVEVWHLPCSGVGFGVLRCGVLRAPRMRCLVPESSRIRSGRGIIGNGATQIGASAVDELFVAVEVGWGGGLLPGVDGKQSCIQGLRGAWLFGIVVEVVAASSRLSMFFSFPCSSTWSLNISRASLNRLLSRELKLLVMQTLSFHSLFSVRLSISSRQGRKGGMAFCAACTSPSSSFFSTTKSFFLFSSSLLSSSLLLSSLTCARVGFLYSLLIF